MALAIAEVSSRKCGISAGVTSCGKRYRTRVFADVSTCHCLSGGDLLEICLEARREKSSSTFFIGAAKEVAFGKLRVRVEVDVIVHEGFADPVEDVLGTEFERRKLPVVDKGGQRQSDGAFSHRIGVVRDRDIQSPHRAGQGVVEPASSTLDEADFVCRGENWSPPHPAEKSESHLLSDLAEILGPLLCVAE